MFSKRRLAGLLLISLAWSLLACRLLQSVTGVPTPPETPTILPQTSAALPEAVQATAILPGAPAGSENLTPTMPPFSSPAPNELYAVAGVAPEDTLNVRAGAGVAYPVVGTIPANGTNVFITGESVDVEGSPWAPVQYRNLNGWVNRNYLARQQGSSDPAVTRRALQIIGALKNRDLGALSTYIHLEKGVRFSPYIYVSENDLVFRADQVSNLSLDPNIYRWGYDAGTGAPFEMTFVNYFDRFVYDKDYASPQVISFNQPLTRGSTIDNLEEFYPDAKYVIYFFESIDPQYGGLDFRGLRLVMEEKDGVWYLVGVAHDEWTP